MTSTDDVHELHREGFSIRAIADRLGLSRMKVHRTLTAAAEADDYGEDDADLDAGPYDDYEPVAPLRFVGLADPEDYKGDPLKDGHGRPFPPQPRALDANGVSVSNTVLAMYRFCAYLDAAGDFAAAKRLREDWNAQLAAAGVWYDDAQGRWRQQD
jgi:hypothetical protein